MAWAFPPEPNQPKGFKFPKRSFGQKNPVQRGFQGSWFEFRSWLHYDETRDITFCHVCMTTNKDNNLSASNIDKAFIVNGFSNWKDAIVGFKKHEYSNCHREAVEKVLKLPTVTMDIGEMLSEGLTMEKLNTRECLLKMLYSVRFLAQQGLAFQCDGDESDSNFIQLLQLRGEDDSKILDWLKRKNEKHTCADDQVEMLQKWLCQFLEGRLISV